MKSLLSSSKLSGCCICYHENVSLPQRGPFSRYSLDQTDTQCFGSVTPKGVKLLNSRVRLFLCAASILRVKYVGFSIPCLRILRCLDYLSWSSIVVTIPQFCKHLNLSAPQQQTGPLHVTLPPLLSCIHTASVSLPCLKIR